MVAFSGTATATWVTIRITCGTFTATTLPTWEWVDKQPARAPLYGWWNIFRPTAQEVTPRIVWLPATPSRAQARSCRLDARRWKRRRWLHALRSATC